MDQRAFFANIDYELRFPAENRHMNHIEMQPESDPDQRDRAQKRRQQFDRNSEWLESHVSTIYAQHRGKCICIAGQEVFVADSANDAIAQATVAHPEDEGWFTRYIPKEKVPRVYAI
jgi:hypothetical protein